ncbi:uncharacterized protein LOC123555301 [Mercenaria mercenaria]|uniref:uncharacterized protein LOC123555301 n=1 Tax=Mercenaria mercenaria TaxID=6596 RepID=UPI00234E6AA9|nr:uncharacterized protein LOC123555301 [Mercenaria mercenaria]
MDRNINLFSSIVYIIKNDKLLKDSSRLNKQLSDRHEYKLLDENRNRPYGYVYLKETQDITISDRGSVKSSLKIHDDLHRLDNRNVHEMYKGLRKLFLTLAVLDVLLIVIVILVISTYCLTIKPDTSQLQTGSKHETIISHLLRNHVIKNVSCVSCNSVRDIEPQLFQGTGDGSCCINGIDSLIMLMKAFDFKTMSKRISDLDRLQKDLVSLKHNLQTIIYRRRGLPTSDTDYDLQSLMNARIKQNNKLINIILNRRRSVLQMSGTASESGIIWRAHVKEGELWHDTGGVHVNQGGRYFVYCKIHFSKQVCDGSEKFEFNIYQQYNSGIYFPVAHAQKGCVNGSRFDDHLMVQSVVDIDLVQNATINIQYDSRYHRFIDRTFETHMMGLFEI